MTRRLLVSVVVVALLLGGCASGGDPRPPGAQPDSSAPTTSAAPPPSTTSSIPTGPLLEPARLGVYRGPCAAPDVDRYVDWLGQDVGVTVDFLGWRYWREARDPIWWVRCWGEDPRRLSLGVPLLPLEGGSLREGAAGAYDEHFRQMASTLVEGGLGDAILRLGWEANGHWFPWRAGAGHDDFVTYWRRVAQVLRNVPGAAFALEWTVATGRTETPAEVIYPGDDVVDIVGITIYDTLDHGVEPHPWETHLQRPGNANDWHDFARARGKPLSVPEWGVTGENPDFVVAVLQWAADADVAYLAYYDSDDSPLGRHQLSGGAHPESGRLLRSLVGGAALATSRGASTDSGEPG